MPYKKNSAESYEERCSPEQELTFFSAETEFLRRGVILKDLPMEEFGLLNTDNSYTSLALLLSEQCRHTIQTAVFQDTTQQIFRDRREFGGSLLKQINDVYDYLDQNNGTGAVFDKLLRIDRRDYPETALREALLNAVVHREYATSGSIFIKIFSDRMEFISPGGLVSGMDIEDIMSGYSACRNPNLAAVFRRLKLIEAYGTSIWRIFEAYKNTPSQPKIEVTPNIFKMILFNINALAPKSAAKLSSEDLIRQYVAEHGSINRKQVEQLLGVSQTAAGVVLRKMTERGELVREGNSRNMRYFLGDNRS